MSYDFLRLHDAILEGGGEPVIPPRLRLKNQHRRYDKIAANFLGFVKIASIKLWLEQILFNLGHIRLP